jgi:hypothetical protein
MSNKYVYKPKEGYMTPGFVPGETYEGDYSKAENFQLLEVEETPKTKRVKNQSGSVVEVPAVRDGETITIE